MTNEDKNPGFRELTANGLRDLIQEHGEARYELIDVRERDEYTSRHLPGARWIALSEFEAKLDQIRPDKHSVFYCGSGMRSVRAALMAAAKFKGAELYSLRGGLAAWDGDTLPNFPNLHVFDTGGSDEDVLLRAMDLEKGAERLYGTLVNYFEASAVRPPLDKLLEAEEAHARLIYGALERIALVPPKPFDELYASMNGDVLESGETYDDVIRRVAGIAPEKRWALLELALDMEFSAYDLYRNLAVRYHQQALEEVLLKLATQEKLHFRIVLEAIGTLASEQKKG